MKLGQAGRLNAAQKELLKMLFPSLHIMTADTILCPPKSCQLTLQIIGKPGTP